MKNQIASSKQILNYVATSYNCTIEFENNKSISRDGFIYRIFDENKNQILIGHAIRYSPSMGIGPDVRQARNLSINLATLLNSEFIKFDWRSPELNSIRKNCSAVYWACQEQKPQVELTPYERLQLEQAARLLRKYNYSI